MHIQQLCILGSTGSIGTNTLSVVAMHPERYAVFALSAYSQLDTLLQQCIDFCPRIVVLPTEAKRQQFLELAQEQVAALPQPPEVWVGPQALVDLASLAEIDTLVAAIVGAAGLPATFAAAVAGKRILLANKEALVISGQLLMDAVRQHNATLLPVDSEHNAIWQALPDDFTYGELQRSGVSQLLLTASGGPFLNIPLEQLAHVTVEQAVQHPNWSMGKKISVDSATMFNKGLELIEACWLFGCSPSDIDVVIHPQSIIHSMVRYIDGSVIAQLGSPDMRTPIAYCLGYPERLQAPVQPLDFSVLSELTFSKPCHQRYPNLPLIVSAMREGQVATTRINAANEIAVEAFLSRRIGFAQIARINQQVLEHTNAPGVVSLDELLHHDQIARAEAIALCKEYQL